MRAQALAARTPDSRNRYVDFLRAVAILAVVIGHWLAVAVEVREGSLTGQNLLAIAEWTHLATWAFQVMPIFFLVGGYANAASWASARRRGQGGLAWLDARTRRLLAPTTLFVAVAVSVLACLRAVGAAVGIDTEPVSLAGWLVGLSLWFLAVYLGVVALTPLTIRWHERWGARVPLGLGLVAGLADVARLGWGIPVVGYVNFVVVWLLVHQLGYAWHDGSLLRSHWTPRLLAFGGLAALLALVTVGPYPVSMVNVPGAQLHNTSPPSLALLALSVAQTGLALLLRAPLSRWCVRPRVWQAVIAVNGVIMSLYLWHMVPVALAAPLLHLTGLFPQPKLASTAWYALRPVWVAVLAVLLIAILVVVARFERPHHLRPAPEPAPRRMSGEVPRLAGAVAATGVLLSCAGLVQLTVGGLSESGPGGVPLAGLAPYAAGVALLRAATRAGAERVTA